MKEKVAIIGLNYQGLAVSRLFGQAGYDVYAFPMPYEMEWIEFRCSKYLWGKVQPYKNPSHLLELLSRQSGGAKIKVFVTSSDSLSQLLLECPELWDRYNVYSGPYNTLELLSNKYRMYDLARKAGLDTKRFCLLKDYAKDSLVFPVILKRNVEKPGLLDYKCVRFNSESELDGFIKKIPLDIKPYIILQECISSDFIDIDMRGYIHDGVIIGSSIVNEIRTFPEGVPSYLEEINDEIICQKVEQSISNLLRDTHFTGFIGIDLKYNLKTNECYILDINPRSPASITSWIYKYKRKDLINLFKNISNPVKLVPLVNNIKWACLNREFQAWTKGKQRVPWLQTFKAKFDVWDKFDPLPFIAMPFCVVLRILKKKFS